MNNEVSPDAKRKPWQGKKGPMGKRSRTSTGNHRFGRVMDSVPCRGKPRFSTLSMAVPGSVLSNCQTRELRTQMVGQLARAATIYHVDEIVVFDDKLSMDRKRNNENSQQEGHRQERSEPNLFMARLFQYCECPQYLRRHFFPMHPDLQFAGLLAPVDAPHHVRANDRSPFREGVVLEKLGPGGKSLVNCGVKARPVEINLNLQAGIRCTVQIDPKAYVGKQQLTGTVVSPSTPRERDGTYWGYTTRMASSIKAAIDECPFEGGYDLTIGTSERGNCSLDDSTFKIPTYRHTLVVFGGVAGIEECVDADESIKLPGAESRKLFDLWVNICPFQGSRTIRTEEAVLISLAKLSPILAKSASKTRKEDQIEQERAAVDLSSDNSLSSEESSGED